MTSERQDQPIREPQTVLCDGFVLASHIIGIIELFLEQLKSKKKQTFKIIENNWTKNQNKAKISISHLPKRKVCEMVVVQQQQSTTNRRLIKKKSFVWGHNVIFTTFHSHQVCHLSQQRYLAGTGFWRPPLETFPVATVILLQLLEQTDIKKDQICLCKYNILIITINLNKITCSITKKAINGNFKKITRISCMWCHSCLWGLTGGNPVSQLSNSNCCDWGLADQTAGL